MTKINVNSVSGRLSATMDISYAFGLSAKKMWEHISIRIKKMAKEYAKWFYKSTAWKKCREGYIASVHGLCERCLDAGRYTPGYIVHHKDEITPGNINDPSITLNWDNLQYVCQECHNRVTFSSDVTREDVMFDVQGNLVQR